MSDEERPLLKLEWTDYHQTWGPMLNHMRSNSLLLDLTIITNDKKMIKAHKVVMAACSEFFRDILSTITSGNYILVLKDVSACLLNKLLDFMYQGEVRVEQEMLPQLLKLGEDLKVTGLWDKVSDLDIQIEDQDKENSKTKLISQLEEDWSESVSITDLCSTVKDESEDNCSVNDDKNEKVGKEDSVKHNVPVSKKSRKLCSFEDLNDDSINKEEITMDLNESLDILKNIENLKSIDEESPELDVFVELLSKLIFKTTCKEGGVIYFCAICQKSLKMKQHIINHIEANHVKGVVHNCKQCGAKMKTRSSLVVHRNKTHRNQDINTN